MFINDHNVFMLFARFSRNEAATAQLPYTSDITANYKYNFRLNNILKRKF